MTQSDSTGAGTGRNAAPRILIIDDELPMARAMSRVLRRAGFESLFASSGLQVPSLLSTFKPTLLTLDIQMPWFDGLDVLRLLGNLPRPLPFKILVVSAAVKLDRALAAGADAILPKPFTNQELVAAVIAQLGATALS